MKQNGYMQTKGPRERELLKLTGKSQMRIGKRLREKYSGLTREEIAGRLLQKYGNANGSDIASANTEQSVVHSLALHPGRIARLEVPADLNAQEAEKLIKFIKILPSNDE